MAPRFRSRITTGLLVAATVLPVPLAATAATASGGWATPVDRPPDLVRPQVSRPHVPPDTYAEEPPLAGSLAGAGRRHPGRPETTAHSAQRPDSDAVSARPEVPGRAENPEGLSDRPSHVPDEPSAQALRPERPPPPSGPDATEPSPSHTAPEPSDSATGVPDSPDLTSPPAGEGAELPPSPSAPSPPASDEAAEPSAQPPPEEHRDLSGRPVQSPYEPLSPPQSLTTPEQRSGSAPATRDNEPAATASPYALDAPASRVERVLPLGAGLAFTGLGLAFLGLRLRRR
ncbi:hypothetical protein [Streptomyces halobius]|uniref:Uncharacterized protein n=1 Tax=Streptomyces halobius TaxID=2879846 RepID=A0ABY4MD91_9ACTN|nr:hypothetical protein [Streptomyces halobius]UQA94336.1 hypothetical protein K9S39_22960 [Streptomyces halobius]